MKHPPLFRIGSLIVLLFCQFGLLLLPQPSLARPAAGQPAHYIVFEKRGSEIAPLFYRQVELADPLQSVSDRQIEGYLAQPSRNVERMVAALQAEDGSIVYQDVVEVSPWLRGEFHGPAAGACTLTLTTLGAKTLVATYGGEASFAGSTSAGVEHLVVVVVYLPAVMR